MCLVTPHSYGIWRDLFISQQVELSKTRHPWSPVITKAQTRLVASHNGTQRNLPPPSTRLNHRFFGTSTSHLFISASRRPGYSPMGPRLGILPWVSPPKRRPNVSLPASPPSTGRPDLSISQPRRPILAPHSHGWREHPSCLDPFVWGPSRWGPSGPQLC